MRKMLKIPYYLMSNYKNKEGKSPIMDRIYYGEEKMPMNTVVNVNPDLWSPKHGHLKGKTIEAQQSNLAIDNFTNLLHAVSRELENEENVTLEKFKSVLMGTNEETPRTLLEVCELDNFRGTVARSFEHRFGVKPAVGNGKIRLQLNPTLQEEEQYR